VSSPILLLRPLGGSTLSWGPFKTALESRLRVITFDPRARSTTRAMAKDAIGVLDDLGVSRAHVFGISLGGMVATWLAIDHASRVDRLVLASTLPKGTMFRRDMALRALSLARCLARPPAQAEACLATRILSKRFRREHPSEVERIRAAAMERPASHRALVTMLAAAARHDATARLCEITAPTLVVAGELDPIVSRASQRLLVHIPHARFELVRGVGHDISVEAPEWLAREVIRHVQI
jgi:pimeloyl-ACP methyl ester carboxylesterase